MSWYRFRTTLARRRGGYVALVLLVAMLGGLALSALAAARRTQSSYPAFLASAHPSDLVLPTALYGLNGAKQGYDATLLREIARLPHVERVESSSVLNSAVLLPNGKEVPPPADAPANLEVNTDASTNGLYITQDAVAITAGRMLDPAHADEFVVSPLVAKLSHWHVGTTVRLGVYTNAQEAAAGPSGDQWRPHAYRTYTLTLVGIGVQDDAIIQDDVDAAGSNFGLFSPALTRALVSCCVEDTTTGLVLDGGRRAVPAVEAELTKLNPILSTQFSEPSLAESKAERALEPESIALGTFGLIAALAALLIVGQTIGRQLRADAEDLRTLRALGASRPMTTLDGLWGVVGALSVGCFLAAVVAVALSPLSPIGPVRRVYPTRGIAFDWTVLGAGTGVLFAVLGVVAVVLARRGTPDRDARRSAARASRTSYAMYAGHAAATTNLPVSAATGIRFALEPGRGRTSVPVRSAIVGTALALVVVVGTVTFASSLHMLVSRPSLYGWNWDYELAGGGGVGSVPQALAAKALDRDRDVAAWTGVYFGNARIDSVTVPVLAATPDSPVHPPILSGHGLSGAHEIVLGASTLAQLHRRIGQTVVVDPGAGKPVRLSIVGTASLPAVGGSGGGGGHLEMGTGGLLDSALVPPSLLDTSGNTPRGPNAELVRFRAGVNRVAALHRLNNIAQSLSLPTNWGVSVVPVQRPAEIVNYRSVSNTPLILGGTLAAGALAALALTLIASVRRRRHDLALLKTFGFTRAQLAGVVAWQSTVSVLVGTLLGVPLGILVGRTLWNQFARGIHAVPDPSVPTLVISLIAVGAVVLANVVAAIPGLQAARTPTAVLLQAE